MPYCKHSRLLLIHAPKGITAHVKAKRLLDRSNSFCRFWALRVPLPLVQNQARPPFWNPPC
jgi:hypothetical protein